VGDYLPKLSTLPENLVDQAFKLRLGLTVCATAMTASLFVRRRAKAIGKFPFPLLTDLLHCLVLSFL